MTSWVVASAHNTASARVNRLSPPGWCTTTVVPEITGTRNSSSARSWTFSTWLSGGTRSPKPPPPPEADGTNTVTKVAAATQAATITQRPAVTAERYMRPRYAHARDMARALRRPTGAAGTPALPSSHLYDKS
jgi:hypothetical protein